MRRTEAGRVRESKGKGERDEAEADLEAGIGLGRGGHSTDLNGKEEEGVVRVLWSHGNVIVRVPYV